MADGAVPPPLTAAQAAATMRSRRFIALLVVASVLGVLVSVAAWGFLELIYQLQRELFTHLPNALGFDHGPPTWWPLPVLAAGGLLTALAITRLPGDGGHLPAKGLSPGGPQSAAQLAGVVLAGLAAISFGVVLGPEAPLIALGSGLALLSVRAARRDAAPQLVTVLGAAGSFAAISFIFGSPLIAAVILIEMSGVGGPRLPLVLLPGLLAAGIGSLVALGMGSFTGLSTSAFALGPVSLSHFGHPDIAQFGWTIGLAAAIAVVTRLIMLGGLATHRVAKRSQVLVLPVCGVIVAGLAIAFEQSTSKSVNEVLFSGQDSLPGLVSQAGTWSLSALALLLVFKGLAWSLSLGSFRGGPTFPALFLGAAAGVMASRLPGFALAPAVAVGMSAAMAAVLKLPLSAAVVGTLLSSKAGAGVDPLVIVGVAVAYLVTLVAAAIPAPKRREDEAVMAPPPAENAIAVAGSSSRG